MLLQLIRKNEFFKNLYVHWLGKLWVEEKKNRILPYLHYNEKIIDVGAGNGLLSQRLQQQGYEVNPVDVANLAIPDDLKVIVYDGKQLPFTDQSQGVALLLTVLHHTDDPVAVLREVARVAHKIVIIEDVYSNVIQQYLTYGMDTLVNFGHSNMTYQNRSVDQWNSIFNDLGLEVVVFKQKRVLLFFRQATFVVQHKK